MSYATYGEALYDRLGRGYGMGDKRWNAGFGRWKTMSRTIWCDTCDDHVRFLRYRFYSSQDREMYVAEAICNQCMSVEHLNEGEMCSMLTIKRWKEYYDNHFPLN